MSSKKITLKPSVIDQGYVEIDSPYSKQLINIIKEVYQSWDDRKWTNRKVWIVKNDERIKELVKELSYLDIPINDNALKRIDPDVLNGDPISLVIVKNGINASIHIQSIPDTTDTEEILEFLYDTNEIVGYALEACCTYKATVPDKEKGDGELVEKEINKAFQVDSIWNFPVGLTERKVVPQLKTAGFVVSVQSKIAIDEPKWNGRYKWTGYPLRDYQEEALGVLRSINRGVIEGATGIGKTEIFMAHIHELLNTHDNGYKILVMVHRKDLLYQTARRLSLALNHLPIGIAGDGIAGQLTTTKANPDGKYTPGIKSSQVLVCIIDTALSFMKQQGIIPEEYHKAFDSKKFDALLGEVDVEKHREVIFFANKAKTILYDECHFTASMRVYLLNTILHSVQNVIGFSATPYRQDGIDTEIEGLIGAKRWVFGIREASQPNEKGFQPLMSCKVRMIDEFNSRLETLDYEPHNWGSDQHPKYFVQEYKACVAENKWLQTKTFEEVANYTAEGRVGFVVVSRIKQGREVATALNEQGITARFVYGRDSQKKRDKATKDLYSGLLQANLNTPRLEVIEEPTKYKANPHAIQVIVTTVFREGKDIPPLSFIARLSAMGKMSEIEGIKRPAIDVVQTSGRIMRICDQILEIDGYKVIYHKPQPMISDFYLRGGKTTQNHSKARLTAYRLLGFTTAHIFGNGFSQNIEPLPALKPAGYLSPSTITPKYK